MSDDKLPRTLAFAATRTNETHRGWRESLLRPSVLQVLDSEGQGGVCELDAEEFIIGRGVEATFQVMSAELSRVHMRVHKARRGWRVEDLDSKNGVYLNGTQVHSALLRNGDLIEVGSVSFVFMEGNVG